MRGPAFKGTSFPRLRSAIDDDLTVHLVPTAMRYVDAHRLNPLRKQPLDLETFAFQAPAGNSRTEQTYLLQSGEYN